MNEQEESGESIDLDEVEQQEIGAQEAGKDAVVQKTGSYLAGAFRAWRAKKEEGVFAKLAD